MSKASKIKRKQLQKKLYKKGFWDKDINIKDIYIKYSGFCQDCGALCNFDDHKYYLDNKVIGSLYPTIDHIIPISRGGLHTWDNVQLLCNSCNIKKGNNLNE